MTTVRPGRLLTYRPAVDGLRAVAVLAVICFHMVPGLLPGGWYGVDTFFVISGFLITSLLLAEYRTRRGRIDLVGFWLARCRRLLPALFAVLAVVVLASPYATAPGRISAVGGDVLATIAYVANWRFVFGDEAYFSDIASPSPLLHTWSLSVEEQFYLLYPLLLVALLAVVRRRAALAGLLGLMALVSAGLMVMLHHPGVEPTRVYFGTDTRAHQLLVGAVAAVLVGAGPGALPRTVVRRMDGWCRRASPFALLVLLTAYWWAGPAQDALFEGWLLCLSVPVAVLLIATTSPSSSVVQRCLAWEPLRLVGVVSYGLYLWHWPVVVFLNDAVLPVPGPLRVTIQAGLTALFAVVSYRWIERPVRSGGVRALVPTVPRISQAAAFVTVPLLLAAAVVLRTSGSQVARVSGSAEGVQVPESAYAPGARVDRVAFIGNSVPQGLIAKFDAGRYPDLRLISITNPGCTTLNAPGYVDGKVQPAREGCASWRDSWASTIRESDPDLVVYFVGQNWVTDRVIRGEVVEFGSPEWDRYVEGSLDDVLDMAGDRPLALVNLSCHDMPTFGKQDLARINGTDYVREVNTTVAAWARQHRAPVIDQYSLLCPGGRFHDTIDGVPLYEDFLHFSDDSADVFWRWLAPRLQRAADDPAATGGPSRTGGSS